MRAPAPSVLLTNSYADVVKCYEDEGRHRRKGDRRAKQVERIVQRLAMPAPKDRTHFRVSEIVERCVLDDDPATRTAYFKAFGLAVKDRFFNEGKCYRSRLFCTDTAAPFFIDEVLLGDRRWRFLVDTSSRRPPRRSRSARTDTASAMSTVSISRLPPQGVQFPGRVRTVAITRASRFSHSSASARPNPREAPTIRAVDAAAISILPIEGERPPVRLTRGAVRRFRAVASAVRLDLEDASDFRLDYSAEISKQYGHKRRAIENDDSPS